MLKRFFALIKNWLSTSVFLWIGYFFYAESGRFASSLSVVHTFPLGTFSTQEALFHVVVAFTLILPAYYFFDAQESSASRFLRGIFQKRFDEKWKLSGRSLLLKGFFAPLMIGWFFSHTAQTVLGIRTFFFSQGFDLSLLSTVPFFVFALQSILLIDVAFFTAGYLFESKFLKNEIVSVDPTVSGWLVCLLCYPPFNGAADAFFGWYSSDTPVMPENPAMTVVLNLAVLSLMAVYAASSAALGWKASNLTNRGIVSRGPYRLVRHPAYAAKNLAWLVGAVPIISAVSDTVQAFFIVFSLLAWSALYYLRAVTEERHLLMGENGYAEYKKNVPYRFVPGIW